MIKRVGAVQGDPLTHAGPRPGQGAAASAHSRPDRVPSGSLVLLGDNARASVDSRQLGCVPAARVLGVVLLPHAAHRGPDPTTSPRGGWTMADRRGTS
ncbi:S26 family signal peptidase [Streptomyces umbrinus]|uniref:S26 family signal peptidase n=1 Tax=Streptomyces umbrinus TaxID=67370 RepID=UPI003594860A